MKTKFTVTKKQLDDVYAVGVRNGGILMRSKILKSLNRDDKLWGYTTSGIDLCVQVLKKINRLSLPLDNKRKEV